jgi:hypothetical protein
VSHTIYITPAPVKAPPINNIPPITTFAPNPTTMFSKPIPVHLLKHDELSQGFRHWQLSQPYIHTLGEISSAAEFARFCKDTDVENFGKSYDHLGRRVASRCGHLIHPATPAGDMEYCAVCEVVAYLDCLDLINSAWSSDGGPWSNQRTKNHGTYVHAWHKTRVELEDLLETFEVAAEYEARWGNAYPEGVEEAKKTVSAGMAIRVVRAMSKYPAAITVREVEKASSDAAPTSNAEPTSQATPPTPPATPTKKKPKKTVNFAPETKFEPGRSNAKYMRANGRYEPGDHAVAEDAVPIDTSFMYNPLYNLRQLKVIVNPQGKVLDDLMNDIAPEEHEGIAEAHRLWGNIRGFVLSKIWMMRTKIVRRRQMCMMDIGRRIWRFFRRAILMI